MSATKSLIERLKTIEGITEFVEEKRRDDPQGIIDYLLLRLQEDTRNLEYYRGRENVQENCVLQDWVLELTLMQQAVLLTALRGPDGIRKDHDVKVLLRWYRRCVLKVAFGGHVLTDPYAEGGGSFTGPLDRSMSIDSFVDSYLRHVDELPHHFQLHFMHAAEIVGYKHPDPEIGDWWEKTYLAIVHDAHLMPETEEQMDWRLGDVEEQWKSNEVCLAKQPRSVT